MRTLVLLLLATGCMSAPTQEECGPKYDGRYAVVEGPGDAMEIATSDRYWASVGAEFHAVYGAECSTLSADVVQRGEVVAVYDLEWEGGDLVGTVDGVAVRLRR